MQTKVIVALLAALAVAVILATAAPPATSQDMTSATDTSALAAMAMPKAAMMTIGSGSVAGGNATFAVPYSAKVYRIDGVDYAAVTAFSKPVQARFDTTTGAGQISWATALPATATFDRVGNSTIPVAGTKAVVAMQDINVSGAPASKDQIAFEFGRIEVYTPDGKIAKIKLDKPVRMSYTIEGTKVTAQADPALANMLAGVLKAGATFPAGAQPVRLNDLLAA